MSSLKKPKIPIIKNPLGVDAIIQPIQIALGQELPYLTASFGRSFTSEKLDANNIREVYPKCFQQKNDYINVLPNDELVGYSFWRVNDPQSIINYNPGFRNRMNVPVDLIVWVNLRRIDPQLMGNPDSGDGQYVYSEWIKKDILETLGDFKSMQLNAVYEEVRQVWTGYTIDFSKFKGSEMPYHSFRFNGTLHYMDNCKGDYNWRDYNIEDYNTDGYG